MVPILKLRAFQDLGHTIVLIIGDATAQVGDTSDKDGERPMLTRDKTRENASNWLSLFAKVLILPPITPPEGVSVESKAIYQGDPRYGVPASVLLDDGSSNPLAGRIPGTFELRYNSEWMDSTNFNAVGELAANFSVAEMLDRDNFSKRYNGGVRISLQEFLYPIMQGLDSVAIHADVELGGNDQYFNLLAGRRLQEAHGQHKQEVMTFDLLVGPDGKKMSKTGGNTIAVNMPPNEMFVKAMEVADHLV
jgi:tyrosyl-tRNA synthetase